MGSIADSFTELFQEAGIAGNTPDANRDKKNNSHHNTRRILRKGFRFFGPVKTNHQFVQKGRKTAGWICPPGINQSISKK